jgi:hypothetical protein
MKVRPIVILTLCFLMLPFFGQPPVPNTLANTETNSLIDSRSPSSGSLPKPSDAPPLPNPDYSGVGDARPVHEISNRTDADQNIFLFYDSGTSTAGTDSASVVLPPGWTGYQLDFWIDDLYENRTWVLNPSFNGGTSSWTNGYNDLGGANTFAQTWQSGGPDGNGYVRVQEDGRWDGSYYRYDNNDRTWWTQTYSVSRSDIDWVGIKLDYRVDSAWGSNALFNVYIRINGTQVWAKGFQSVGDTSWHNTGFLELDPGLFDIPSSAIELEIGMFSTMSVGYSSNDWMRVEFDNVWLYMKTKVYPTEINLQMNGLAVQNQASRGSGFVRQIPASVWTTNPVISNLVWAPTPNPPNPNLDIEVTGVCDLNLFANKTASTVYAQSPTAYGVGFNARSGQDTSWTFYYQLALPSQYWDDIFNFTIPSDWNITFVSEPQLPTINKVAQCSGGNLGDGYLSIPTTDITVSPDGYWMIEAESHNYVDSAELQIYDGGWSPTSTVRAGNTTRVAARILDGSDTPPIGVTSTQANASIYEPGGGLWYTELVSPSAQGWVYSSSFYHDGWNTTGGTYNIFVTWDNATEAGEYQISYTVQHSTSLTPRESLIEAFLEDQPLYPKVRYEDSDSHSWLEPPATIVGNWTTGTISFHYVSGTGYYEAEINAMDPGTVGQFWIRVNASKTHYDDAYTYILIDLVSETDVESPQVGGVEVPWRGNTTVAVRYTQKIGGGVTGATITSNWTAGFYTITEGTDGWYYIELNSTGPGAIGTYMMNVTLYKERYQRQQIRIPVFVTPMTLIITTTVGEPVNVTYGEQFWVEVYVENFLGEAFPNANVSFSWTGGTLINDTGVNALYGVWFNSSKGNIGIHYLTVYVTGPNVIPGVKAILIHVQQIGSILDTVPTGQYSHSIIQGELFSLTFNYSTEYGDPVELATVTYVLGSLSGSLVELGNGIYTINNLDTQPLVAGSYTLYVTASSPNVDSQSRAISLILTLIPAEIAPETVVYNIYWGDDFTITVFFRNLSNDTAISGATIDYSWGPFSGSLIANGTPGWYTVTLPSTGFAAGSVYAATLTANEPKFQFVVTSVNVFINARPTDLELVAANMYFPVGDMTTILNISEAWTVPRSDILYLYFNFTDYVNTTITDATGVYTWLWGSGVLIYDNGLYYAEIDMTQITPGGYFLDVTFTRQNYEIAQVTQMPLTVTLVQTRIELVGITGVLRGYTGDPLVFTLILHDDDHNTIIDFANVTGFIQYLTPDEGLRLTNHLNGQYSFDGFISFPIEGTYIVELTAQSGLVYQVATLELTAIVTLHPLIQQGVQYGLIAALLGIIILAAWVAYTRVFSIPWLVRKMRGMSKTIGQGKTPNLTKGDVRRIATRPESMETIVEPAYGSIGVAVGASMIPAAITMEERQAEDELIWQELEKIEGLGHDQKLELFEEMKRIPAKDRVWFIEDLKEQMADGTRFGRIPAEPTLVPEGVDPSVHARLEALEALGPAEKEAVIEQLRGLSKEEQEEVIKALEDTERQAG